MGLSNWYYNKKEEYANKWATVKEAYAADTKGWQICAAVLMVTIVRSGITYSFGIFVVKLQETYSRPLAEQNWIGTLSFCISLCCAPLSVQIIRIIGHNGYRIVGYAGTIVLTISCMGSSFVTSLEWMFLTHSLLYGIGSSLLYMASSLVIGEYFDKDHKYHVLATSILLCGYPVGSLLFNPINAWLVQQYGWRVAFRASSILIAISGGFCCFIFKSKDKEHMDEHDGKRWWRCCTMHELRQRPEILLWLFGNTLSYLGFFMPFLNLAYYMDLKHIGPTRSSWALTLLSLTECITYIIASLVGDRFKGRLVYVNIIACIALALICFIWPFVDISYYIILLISAAMGGFLGLTIVYTYAASGEVTQLPLDIAWSFTNMWSGFGILIGPFFSGAIFDLRQSYDDVFYTIGVLFLIACAIFTAIPASRYFRGQHNIDYDEITGVVSSYKTTFRVTKRSISKTSLIDEECFEGEPTTPPPYQTVQTQPAASAQAPPEEVHEHEQHRPYHNGGPILRQGGYERQIDETKTE